MKRSLPLLCLLATAVGSSALAQTSPATRASAATSSAAEPPSAPGMSAPAGPSKVAVIAFQPVVIQTNEGQRNIAQMQTKFGPKQAQLKSASDEVDTLKKQLQTSGSTLSDAERQSRLRTIDEKEKALQRTAEDAQNDFNSEMQEMYQQLAQKVYNVVQSYAQQNGYTVVLDASQGQGGQAPVLWASQSTDISKAVIDAYNAKSGVPPQPTPANAAPARSTSPNHVPTSRTSTSTTPRTPQ